jgi:UDP-N-acetylmuramate dehydrogenase
MITLKEQIPLAPFTTLGVGGPARYFAEARSLDELREALKTARERGLPWYLLGGGSNLMISDRGLPGLVVRMLCDAVQRLPDGVRAEAGADLTALVHQAADWGLAGLEPLAGIPGSLGGAVRGNAGAYGGSIGEVCAEVTVLDARSLELASFPAEECRFSYRSSRFKADAGLIVVAARLRLQTAAAEEIREQVAATLARRAARHLACSGSAGSFFMNPLVHDRALLERFEREQQVRSREGRIPAGWLIDQAGLRSLRVGAAQVSPRHANYLVNTGGASAREMLELARLVKARVKAATGVELMEEVSRLGFAPDELEG